MFRKEHLPKSLRQYLTEQEDYVSLYVGDCGSEFPLSNGQSLYVRVRYTTGQSLSLDIIVERSGLVVDDAFRGLCENTEITGRVGLQAMILAKSIVKNLLNGGRTIWIHPSDDRREEAYRYLERMGFRKTRYGSYVSE